MNLVIFDLDGTLTDTNEVDNRCYQETFVRMFGFHPHPRDFHGLINVTDSGILEQLLKNHRGNSPTSEETAAFKEAHFERLRMAHSEDPAAFVPIAGAGEMVRKLSLSSNWAVALATGSWRISALFKLRSAGIGIPGIPLATSDDAVSRVDIVNKALALARPAGSENGFEKIVSVGDAEWDVETARRMGLPFIGIGDTDQLIGWGAPEARADMRKGDEFMDLLERARPIGREEG